MPFIDLPPQLQERVICSISAAVKYEVPANIVLAVAEKEGGKPGQWVKNTNGTHDVGPMQFNTLSGVDHLAMSRTLKPSRLLPTGESTEMKPAAGSASWG